MLAELSGIDVHERRGAAARLRSICDAAEETTGALLRAVRENYITPVDRTDLYSLADAMRNTTYRLDAMGFALSSSAFAELPVGTLEMLGLLSNQGDHTLRMTGRLRGKLDQWEYIDEMNHLHRSAIELQQRVSDAVPASRQGLSYLAAAMQLGSSFMDASRSFKETGKIVATIAIKES